MHLRKGLEPLISIHLYNLQHQIISSPFLVKYEPYKFQKYILLKALRSDKIKLFLADEVGLGKTIEALLIIQELILTRNYRKILIIMPKSLIKQWQDEINNWTYLHDQITVYFIDNSRHLVKALTEEEESKFVMCSEKLFVYDNNYNKNTVEWDLIVVDEVHHARSYEYYSSYDERIREDRNELYKGLMAVGEKSKSFIFLSATPIQLQVEEFKKLVEIKNKELFHEISFEEYKKYHPFIKVLYFLLDEYEHETSGIDKLIIFEKINEHIQSGDNLEFWESLIHKYGFIEDTYFVDYESLDQVLSQLKSALKNEHLYCKILIRNRKKDVFQEKFKKRNINDCPVEMHKTYAELEKKIKKLVQTFESYSTDVTDHSSRFKRGIIGYMISSYREYMSSSMVQIKQSLKNRMKKKIDNKGEIYKTTREYLKIKKYLARFEDLKEKDDAKLNKLLEIMEESKEIDRIIIFANFYATIDYLHSRLQGLNKEIHLLTGKDAETQEERKEVIKNFNEKGGILLSSNIGGEGLNLQASNVLINYDLHWNPTKLEQRIGRIDRIGQSERVIVYNIYYKDSVAGKIYTTLKQRLEYQTQSIGEIAPILEEVSRVIRENEGDQLESLTENQVSNYNSEIESRIRDLKEDLILKQESFDTEYFYDLEKYIPKLHYMMLLNFMNYLKYGYGDFINQKHLDYHDNLYYYSTNFVFNINSNSLQWDKIKSMSVPHYWKYALKKFIPEESNKLISFPMFNKLENYYHGIGDPTLNLLIKYFGKEALNNDKILFSKVNSSELIGGYIFFYRFRFKCGFFKHYTVFPVFFNSNGNYMESISKKSLIRLLTDSTFVNSDLLEVNIDFDTINSLPFENISNKELENFKNLMLKERDYITEQRIYGIKSEKNFTISIKEKERLSTLSQKQALENKQQISYLSKDEKKRLKWVSTRSETLKKDINEFLKAKEEEIRKLINYANFRHDKNLFLILKTESSDREEKILFKIEESFSNKSEIYIDENFSFKLTTGIGLTELIENNVIKQYERIKFRIKVNNVVIPSKITIDSKPSIKNIYFNDIRSFKNVEITFKLTGVSSDIINVSLYFYTESTQVQLFTKDIQIHLYKIFLEKDDELKDLSVLNTESIITNQKYNFLIKTLKILEEISVYTKDKNGIDKLIDSRHLKLIDEQNNLKTYQLLYEFRDYGKFFFKILGIKSEFYLLIIPPIEVEFPDLKNINNFIIGNLDNVFLIIKGNIRVLEELLLKNLKFILKNRNFKELFNRYLEDISIDERFRDIFEELTDSNEIKIPFSSIVPEDINKLRIGEYLLEITVFDIKLETFWFKLFPEIYLSYIENFQILNTQEPISIQVHIHHPEHVRFTNILEFKFQELKYKYLDFPKEIKCEEIIQDAEDDIGSINLLIKPPLNVLLPGECYSINMKTEFEAFAGHSFEGPKLNLASIGYNEIYGYDGMLSKYLLIKNIGYDFFVYNGKNIDLDIGLNAFRIKDFNDVNIKFNGNSPSIRYIHSKQDLNIADKVLNELNPNNTVLPIKVHQFFDKELKKVPEQRTTFIRRDSIQFIDFIFKAKSYFNNIYIIYPTEELFQEEIAEVIFIAANTEGYEDLNINLVTFPSPGNDHVYDEVYEETFQKRKIYPMILERCHKCGSLKKFNELKKEICCNCTNGISYDDIPPIHFISSKILLTCRKCSNKLYLLLYKEKRNKITFICKNCDTKLSNVNILFKKFEFSQINSLNFMTVEQFDYSTRKNYIENDVINTTQIDMLKNILKYEDDIKQLWEQSYPQELKLIKEEIIDLRNQLYKPKKKKKRRPGDGKPLTKINKSHSFKRDKSRFKLLFSYILKPFKKIAEKIKQRKTDLKEEEIIKNGKEIIKEDLIHKIKKKKSYNYSPHKEMEKTLKELKNKYDQKYAEWKNEIRTYFEHSLLKESDGFYAIEQDTINDIISSDEFDLLEELEVRVEEDKTTHYFLNNTINFLKGLKIINDYLNLNENFPEIIQNFLEKRVEKREKNLFIYMDLNNVPQQRNNYIKSFSYIKEQVIKFNNEFCKANNRHYGLAFY